MKVFFFTIIFLIVEITVLAQPIERRAADSLFKILSKEKQGIERIKALNRLAQFYIFKPGENQIDFDSASRYTNEARRLNESTKSASLNGQLLLTESYMLKEKNQKNEAMQKNQEAIKILDSSSDKYNLGKAFSALAEYYDYMDVDELKQKIAVTEKSLFAFQQSKATLEEAETLKILGDLYSVYEKPDTALEFLKKAIVAYDSVHHKALQGVHIELSRIYMNRDDYKQAIYNGLLALSTAINCNDTSLQLCEIYYTLGTIYGRCARWETAITYEKEAMKIAIKYDDHFSVALSAAAACRYLSQVGRPEEALHVLSTIPQQNRAVTSDQGTILIRTAYLNAYLETGQYSKAKLYCDTLHSMETETTINPFILANLYRSFASYYLATGQFQRSRYYIIKNKPLSKRADGRAVATNEQQLYQLDSAEGNYQSAFRHLLIFKAMSDSLLNETKSRQFQQLEVEYETTKKDDSLKQQAQHISLLQQRNNLQQTNLKQANLIKNISIIGTVFILIALVLLYYQFKKNERSNKIILQKNEELKDMLAEKEWWLKEVHHRVKNNLHTIICLLESQAMYLEKDALQAIEKSQHRIYAMSLIHQKLYQNEDLQVIDMSMYLEEFIGYLKDSFDTEKIDFVIQVDPVQLNLQQAIPVALIINEGVTNAIKYAFENENEPKICISMTETGETVKLTIMDNGRGFEMKEEDEGKSLGMQLIKGLGKELKGTVRIDTKGGTKLIFEFKKGPLTDEMAYTKSDNIEQ